MMVNWLCQGKSLYMYVCDILFIQMLNRLTKSAELQVRVDEEYFNTNMESHHIRLNLENTLKTCYQVPADFTSLPSLKSNAF